MTLEKLAQMMGRGFTGVDEKFKSVDEKFKKVDARFDNVDARLDNIEAGLTVLEVDVKEVKNRLDKIEVAIANLAGTLDAFLKRLTDREEEFVIMKREIGIIKQILKEKLRVDVDLLK